MRGIAILGVIFMHASFWVSPETSILNVIANAGARGVQLFYIASALTIFLSLQARSHEPSAVYNFFIRRFFRIAPMFYIAILIYLGYKGMSARYMAPNGLEAWYIPVTFLFVHGWDPKTINSVVPGGWSIAVEMTFYIIAPLLFVSIKSLKVALAFLIITLMLGIILTKLALAHYLPLYSEEQNYLVKQFVFFWFFSQLPIFVMGIILFLILGKYPECKQVWVRHSLLPASLVVVVLAFFPWYPGLEWSHYFFGISFILFGLFLNYSGNRLFINAVTTSLGKISFSLYLVHIAVLDFLKTTFEGQKFLQGDAGFIGAFVILMVVSIAISSLTYRIVELPGIATGKKLLSYIGAREALKNACEEGSDI